MTTEVTLESRSEVVPAAGDYLPIKDISEATASATLKRVTMQAVADFVRGYDYFINGAADLNSLVVGGKLPAGAYQLNIEPGVELDLTAACPIVAPAAGEARFYAGSSRNCIIKNTSVNPMFELSTGDAGGFGFLEVGFKSPNSTIFDLDGDSIYSGLFANNCIIYEAGKVATVNNLGTFNLLNLGIYGFSDGITATGNNGVVSIHLSQQQFGNNTAGCIFYEVGDNATVEFFGITGSALRTQSNETAFRFSKVGTTYGAVLIGEVAYSGSSTGLLYSADSYNQDAENFFVQGGINIPNTIYSVDGYVIDNSTETSMTQNVWAKANFNSLGVNGINSERWRVNADGGIELLSGNFKGKIEAGVTVRGTSAAAKDCYFMVFKDGTQPTGLGTTSRIPRQVTNINGFLKPSASVNAVKGDIYYLYMINTSSNENLIAAGVQFNS